MATYTTPIQDAPLDLSLPRRAEGLVASFTGASEGVADLRDFQDEEVFIPEVPESRPVTPTTTQTPTNCQYVHRDRAYERARASVEHDRFFGGARSSANLALEIATLRADELARRDRAGVLDGRVLPHDGGEVVGAKSPLRALHAFCGRLEGRAAALWGLAADCRSRS